MKREYFKELRSFLLLWGTQTASELGTAMTNYALITWVYGQKGTAVSITWLTICTFLPTILFRFIGGTLADRWNKKRILLLTDALAACGSATILTLHSVGTLQVWQIYLINVLLSCMNAFQVPATFVATSLLVPKEHYARVSGLQGFSGAAVSILAPALGSSLLAFGGMSLVLALDLCTFTIAMITLSICVRIPEEECAENAAKESFVKSCAEGFHYLRGNAAMLHMTLFMAVVNLLAKMGNDGMLSPFILARTNGNQQILGLVQSCVSMGVLAGSLLVSATKPPRDRVKLIFVATALVFAGNIVQSLSVSPWLWCAAAFASYMIAAVMNANLTTVMRTQVPVHMQGRVFSVKDTLQNGSIPLGLLAGGLLADYVMEPLMATNSLLQHVCAQWFGTRSGAGIALLFFLVGALGIALSLLQLKNPIYKKLNE